MEDDIRCTIILQLYNLSGLSNTIGSPLYILTGFVIKTKAGPAIVISYLIASISSLCAALTYR